jgi:hypothetical protein
VQTPRERFSLEGTQSGRVLVLKSVSASTTSPRACAAADPSALPPPGSPLRLITAFCLTGSRASLIEFRTPIGHVGRLKMLLGAVEALRFLDEKWTSLTLTKVLVVSDFRPF